MNNLIKNKARGCKKKREIKKIDAIISSRQVFFSKRRVGVLKKASELCVLTGAEGVVLCESLGGRVYAFAHPNVESVVDKFLGDKSSSELLENNSAATESQVNSPCMHEELKKQYLEVTKEIEIEKNKSENVIGGISDNFNNTSTEEGDLFWWQQPFEHLEVEELEEYISSMEELMIKLELRANDLMLINSSSSMGKVSNSLNLNHSRLSAEHLVNRNLNMKDYGFPPEFLANKNITTMDNGLPLDEFFANKNLTNEKDYELTDECLDECLANKNMTMMDYGLRDEFFVNENFTTKDDGLPDAFFANKNLTTKDYGLPDEFFANKNPTTTIYGLLDEFSANKNLSKEEYGLLNEFFANKNWNFDDDGLLNEFLAIKDPNFNDELDGYITDLELSVHNGNNVQVSKICANSTGNEVQLSQINGNLVVPDNYGKAVDLHSFGTDFSVLCPPK